MPHKHLGKTRVLQFIVVEKPQLERQRAQLTNKKQSKIHHTFLETSASTFTVTVLASWMIPK